MSDTWYRDPLPPYEDGFGNLWTLDGVCLNPLLGPERPPMGPRDHTTLIAMAWSIPESLFGTSDSDMDANRLPFFREYIEGLATTYGMEVHHA